MFKKKNILKILLAFLLLFISPLFISPLSALAEEIPPLTGVVVEIEDKSIVVNMLDYSIAYGLREESPLYNYLNSDGGIRVIGYESNEKYMDSLDYAIAYGVYGSLGAINNTEALSIEDIRDYFVFKGFDDVGDPILVPLFASEALRVKLEHIKTLIEDNYSMESWSNLQAVVSSANLIYEDRNSTNDDYKNAVVELDGAINALQFSKTLTEEKFYTLVQEDYLYDEAVIKFRLNEDGEDEIIGLFLTTDVNQIINLAEDLFASVLPEAGVTGITINGEPYEIKEENIVKIAKAVLDAMEASPSNPNSFHGVSVSFMGTIGYEGYELIDKEFISYFYVAEVFAEEIQAAIDELPEVDEVSLEDKGKIVSVREKLDEAIVIHPDFGVHFANEIENLEKLENKIADLEAEDEAAERIAEEFKITHAGVLYKEVENILIADKAALNIALFEYDGLSDLVQSKLVVEISLLDELLIQINSLEDQVDNVKTSITTLPNLEKLTLEDKSVVEAVRTAYDLLTSEQQGLIDNYEYLIKTEAKIVELEDDLSATNEANTYRLIHEDILRELVEDILIADKDAVTTALTVYDELSELAQSKLSNENSLLGELLIKIVGLEEEVEDVKSTIATLPNLDVLTLDDKVSVVSSREAYELLTSEQQELIDNYDELISAEARIVDLEAEKNAEQYRNTHADILVKEVNDVLIADKDAVTTALTDYNELSDLEQSKLSNEYSLLGELLIKIKGLENQVEQVEYMIHGLPDLLELDLGDKSFVEAAREAYELLTSEQQELIDNYDELISAEARIVDLEAEKNAEQYRNTHADILVKEVNDVLIADKDAVTTALTDYNELSDLEQSKLSNEYSLLGELLIKIKGLENQVEQVEYMIHGLPDLLELDLGDKSTVDAIRDTYDLLTPEQKGLIDNYSALETAESKIMSLLVEQAKNELAKIAGEKTLELNEIPQADPSFNVETRTLTISIQDKNASLLSIHNTGVISLLGEVESVRGYSLGEIEKDFYDVNGNRVAANTIKGWILEDALEALELEGNPKLSSLLDKSFSVKVNGLIDGIAFSDEYTFEFIVGDEAVEQAKNELAKIAGDKTSELNKIPQADPSFDVETRTLTVTIQDKNASLLSIHNTGVISLLGEVESVRGYSLGEIERDFYDVNGNRIAANTIKGWILEDALEALELEGNPKLSSLLDKSFSVKVNGLIDGIAFSDDYTFEFTVGDKAVKQSKNELAEIAGDKTLELNEIAQADPSFDVEMRTLTVTIQDKNASLLSIHNTGVISLLGEVESVRGYSLGEIERDFYDVNGNRIAANTIKGWILEDALEALELEGNPKLSSLLDKSFSVKVNGLIDGIAFSDEYTFEFIVGDEAVEQAKNEFAEIAGDKTLELNEIAQADPSFDVEMRTLTVTIQDKNASLLSIHNTGVISLLGEVESVRGYSLGEIERDFYDVNGNRIAANTIKGWILEDALEALELEGNPKLSSLLDKSFSVKVNGLIDGIAFSDDYTFEFTVGDKAVKQSKNELAEIAGDKTLELNEIAQADPSFDVEMRTLTVTIQDKNASLLSIHNTGVISLLGEVESVRGYSLGEIERDFYDVNGNRIAANTIKGWILEDALEALELEGNPKLSSLLDKSFSVKVNGLIDGIAFSDEYTFEFIVGDEAVEQAKAELTEEFNNSISEFINIDEITVDYEKIEREIIVTIENKDAKIESILGSDLTGIISTIDAIYSFQFENGTEQSVVNNNNERLSEQIIRGYFNASLTDWLNDNNLSIDNMLEELHFKVINFEIKAVIDGISFTDSYKLSFILSPSEEDKQAAEPVIALINELTPVTNLTLDDNVRVVNAREAYDTLTAEEKLLIENLDFLLEAETRMINLEAAAAVDSLIEAIPEIESIILADEDKVVDARDAYGVLTDDQKAEVKDYSKLVSAEGKINQLKESRSDLDQLLEQVGNFVEEDYTSDSWSKLSTALSMNEKTYEEMQDKIDALVTTLGQMEFSGQAQLDEIKEVANTKVESTFTASSWNDFENARADALDIKEDSNDAVLFKTSALSAAIDLLVERTLLTVSAKAVTVRYGHNPEYSVNYEGFLGADTAETALKGKLDFISEYQIGDNAGSEFVVTPYGLTADNYTIVYEESTLQVVPEKLTITADNIEATYGEAEKELTYKITEGQNLNDEVRVLLIRDGGNTVGQYEITVFVVPTANYVIDIEHGLYTINKKPVTVKANNSSKVYGAVDPSMIATVTGLVGSDTINYTVERTDGEDVGTYTITTSGDETQGNYTVAYETGTFTINKAIGEDLDITNYSSTYDGAEHSIEVATLVDNDTVYYAVGEGEWSTQLPTFSNVGTYTVNVKVENKNYEDRIGTGNVVINHKPVTVKANNSSKVYGAVDPSMIATVTGLVGSDTINYTVERTDDEDVGTYTITTSGDETQGNYTVAYETGTFTINKAIGEDLDITNYSSTYDGAEHSIEVATLVDNDTVYYAVGEGEWSTQLPTFSNVGTYTVNVKVENKNYEDRIGTGNVVINHKPVTVKANNSSKVYGAVDPSMIATVTGLVGSDTINYTVERTDGEDVGTYTITTSGDETQGNYTVAYETGTFTINKAIGEDLDITNYSSTYDGAEHSIEVATLVDNDTVYYAVGEGEWSTQLPTFSNVGTYTVNVKVENKNYEDRIGTGNVVINHKPVTVKANNSSKVYGAVDPSMIATVTGLVGSDTINYTVERTDDEDVGTYTITTSGDETQGNYTVAYETGTFTINKAIGEDLDITNYSSTYDGAEHSIEVATLVDNDTVYYAVGEGEWSTQLPTFSNVGTYTVNVKVENKNYEDRIGTGNVVINHKPVTVKANNSSKVYGAVDPSMIATVTGLVGSDTINYTVERANGSGVGTYTITASGEQTQGNYSVSYETGTFTIIKATIDRVEIGEDSFNVSEDLYIINRDYTDNTLMSDGIGDVELYSNVIADVNVADDYSIVFYDEENGNEITNLDNYFDLSNGGTTFRIYMIATSKNSNREDFEGNVVFKYGSVTIGNNSTYFTVEDALKKASDGNTIIVKHNTSFAEASVSQLAYGKVTHNVSSGVTLLIPYDRSYSQKLNDTPSGSPNTGGALSRGNAYVRLVMPTDISLDIYGTVTINAMHANNSTKFSGHVTGTNYAELEMQSTSKITVQNDGVLNSSGFIYGDGEIEALSGSTVYEFLFIKSFRGGTATTRVQGSVFPIDQFTVNSIEAKTTYLSGSKLNAKVLTYMSSSYQKGDINLIGTGAGPIFDLKQGSLVKSYNKTTGDVTFDLHGNASLNNTSVSISGINLSSNGKDMPFDGTWHIKISSGSDLQINSYVALLPGATVTIEEGASATITSNGRVTVFDPYKYITDGHIKNYPETSQSYYRELPVFSFNNDTPAVMNVNGELSIEAGGAIAGRVRTGDNGRIILDNKAVTKYEFKYVEDNARVASREVEFEDVDHGVPFRMFFESGPGSFDYNFIYADDSSGNYELTNLPIPTIGDKDFRFDGWYTSRDYLIKVAESFAATGDITVYAKWITDVKFVKNDGSDEESIIPQIYGKDYEYPDWYDETVFWFTDSTGGEPYIFVNPVEKIDHNMVYARWNLIPKNVTFQSNGGTEFDSLSVVEGTVINLDDYTPTKEDAVFQGWYTKGWNTVEEFDLESRVSSTLTVVEDIIFYARWADEKSNIKIELESNKTEQTGAGDITLTATVTDDYGPVEGVSVYFDALNKNWKTEVETGQHNSGKYGKATAKYSATNANDTVKINATEQVTESSDSVEIKVTYEQTCVADGTLITLADGSQKPVEELTGDELLLVWNLETGSFDIAPIAVNFAESFSDYEIIHLHFSDGTDVKIIDEHAFWNFDLNRYAFINKDNAQEYLGHWFKKQITDADGNLTWTKVELIDVDIKHEYTRAWTPITYEHLSFYANGMLSMTGEIEGIVNTFEVSPETMKIDQNAYLADIAEYGLFTYEEFAQLINVPEEMFDAFQAKYLKVSIGKGHITLEDTLALIMQYGKWLGLE